MGSESADRVRPVRVGRRATLEPQPAEPPTTAAQRVLRLQTVVGNAAVTRLLGGAVARQPSPPPTLPTAAPDTSTIVEKAVRGVLVAAIEHGEELAQFIERLRRELTTALAFDPNVLKEVDERLWDLPAVVHRGTTQDHVSTAHLLSRVAGLPAELEVAVSFGMGLYLNEAARDIASFLLGHATSDELTEYLLDFLDRLAGPADLLELELEGAVDELIQLRSDYEAATNRDERAALGEELGNVSRRVLMLQQALAELRKGAKGSQPATGPLETALSAAAGRIDAIRTAAETEKETRKALGDRPELLQPALVATEGRFGGDPMTVVDPEEALPETSDAASVKMVRDLEAHVRAEAGQVDALHAQVIPSQRPPTFETFGQVYRRWFAFFSPATRNADPLYRQMDEFFTTLWQGLGKVGIEGGLARVVMMESLGSNASSWIGGAQADFTSELGTGRPERREATLGGTAASPDFAYAETYRRTKTPGYGPGAEEESRQKLLTMRGLETKGQFEQIQRAGPKALEKAKALGVVADTAHGALVLQSERTRDAWSYLISAQDPLTDQWTWEEKSMPQEVAAYLLAREQQARTLGAAHKPGYGEAGVRAGGVEKAEATATARYVEGFTPDLMAQGVKPRSDASSQAAASRGAIEAERQKAAPKASGGSASQRLVNELVQDLERYLDEYFSSKDDAAHRIAGVLRIANYEYDVAKRFLEQLKPEKLAEALALAVAIQGVLWAVARFGGYIGKAISTAIGVALEKMGLKAGAAAIAALDFLHQARGARSFQEARGYAYFAKGVADDLGEILQDLAVSTAIKGFKAVKMTAGGKPADAIRDLEPILKDPEVREVFREQLDTAIAERQRLGAGKDEADPELDDLLAARSALRKAAVPDPAPGGKDPVGGTRGTDVYQPHPKKTLGPKDLDAQVERLAGADGWAVQGTTLAKVGQNRYALDVPLAAGGAARVEVETVSAPAAKLAPSQHGAEGGPARVELTPPAKPGDPWKAKVYVDQTVMKDDVRFVVGHELDEVAGIVHRRPTATKAEIAAEMQAGVFTATPPAGTTPQITAHDRATAFELYELHLARQESEVALTKALRGGKPDEIKAVEAQIQRRQESIDRLVHWMALDNPTNIDLKVRALRGAGKGDEWDAVVGQVQREGADAFVSRFYAARGGIPPPGSPVTTALVSHLRYPNPHAADPPKSPGTFKEWGIHGGHEDATLRAFVADNPQYGYAIVPMAAPKSSGGVTYQAYHQYLWTGAGPMPRPGDPSYPRAGQPPPAGWVGADYPKTTVDKMDVFLGEVEGAVAGWRAGHPGANLPEGDFPLVTASGVPLTVWVRGGRVVNAYAQRVWATT